MAPTAQGLREEATPHVPTPRAPGDRRRKHHMHVRRGSVAALLASAALFVAACGGDDDNSTSGGGSSGSSGGQSTGQTKGVAAAPTLDAAKGAKGTVVYCTGKDTSGGQKASVKAFNEKFKAQGLSAKLLEFPESADLQHDQFAQRQQAKSADCDIFYSDVVWTAEF